MFRLVCLARLRKRPVEANMKSDLESLTEKYVGRGVKPAKVKATMHWSSSSSEMTNRDAKGLQSDGSINYQLLSSRPELREKVQSTAVIPGRRKSKHNVVDTPEDGIGTRDGTETRDDTRRCGGIQERQEGIMKRNENMNHSETNIESMGRKIQMRKNLKNLIDDIQLLSSENGNEKDEDIVYRVERRLRKWGDENNDEMGVGISNTEESNEKVKKRMEGLDSENSRNSKCLKTKETSDRAITKSVEIAKAQEILRTASLVPSVSEPNTMLQNPTIIDNINQSAIESDSYLGTPHQKRVYEKDTQSPCKLCITHLSS